MSFWFEQLSCGRRWQLLLSMSTRLSLAVGIPSIGHYMHYIAHVKQHVLVITLFTQSTWSVYGIGKKKNNEFLIKQKGNSLAVVNGTQNVLKINPDNCKHIPQQNRCSEKQIMDVNCARRNRTWNTLFCNNCANRPPWKQHNHLHFSLR
jgi:hypothetical protein